MNIVNKVFHEHNECHFTSKKDVCSPEPLIKSMEEYIKKEGKTPPKDPKKIIHNMKELLNCNSESCILKRPDFQQFAKINNMNAILDNFFKPSGPAINFGLLSNINIDEVLDQFQEKFKQRKFLHIPYQMRDFEKVGSELATVDLAEQFKKYDTFGVVFNTDWSSGRGIHWFCIFGERYADKIVLEYFNSSGKDALPEVQAWLQKTKHYLTKELKIPVFVHYNTGIQYQSDEHSCGVYSLAYIWLRLENIPPNWFKSENFNDELMHKLRKNLFRWEV